MFVTSLSLCNFDGFRDIFICKKEKFLCYIPGCYISYRIIDVCLQVPASASSFMRVYKVYHTAPEWQMRKLSDVSLDNLGIYLFIDVYCCIQDKFYSIFQICEIFVVFSLNKLDF